MTYMLAQHGGAQMEVALIIVKHHLHEGWYLADGALVSVSDISVTQFLHNTRYTRRCQSIEEMNLLVKTIVPKMLRENGVPSIPVLMKYARLAMLHLSYIYKPPHGGLHMLEHCAHRKPSFVHFCPNRTDMEGEGVVGLG